MNHEVVGTSKHQDLWNFSAKVRFAVLILCIITLHFSVTCEANRAPNMYYGFEI